MTHAISIPFCSAKRLFPYEILMRRHLVRQTLPFPNKTLSRGHSVRQTAFSRTKLWLAGAERYLMVKEIMRKFALIFGKEAAPRVRSGSYADRAAGQGVRLPLAVVGPHVDLPSSDHPEVASDKNRFASCFLALCAKALSEAKIKLDIDHNCGMNYNCKLESWERLVKSTSSALSQNKRSICLSVGRRSLKISLESAPIHTDQNPPQRYLFIPDLQALAVPYGKRLFPVRNLSARPFGTANGLFPYEILMRRHLVRQTAFSRTESTLCCTALGSGRGVGRWPGEREGCGLWQCRWGDVVDGRLLMLT